MSNNQMRELLKEAQETIAQVLKDFNERGKQALAAEPANTYARENPLGGPAKVFEAMAAAIRAGDSYHNVLNQFGFAEANSAEEAPAKYFMCKADLHVNGQVPCPHCQPLSTQKPAEEALHPDDDAVNRFALAMKQKLELARKKGRSGWQEMDSAELSAMLREHVEKGDPRDVANFCMFLWHHGYVIESTAEESQQRPTYEKPSPPAPMRSLFERVVRHQCRDEKAQPVACLVGIKGRAFDTPETRRAYTYKEQPDNIVAMKLGMACRESNINPSPDCIDLGLSLLKSLQDKGFGVFNLGAEYTHPTPEAVREPVARVLAEITKATAKFPTWPTDPLHAVAVLGEEFGELTKAVLQHTYEPHKSTADDVRTEAIQTAAMALRFLMSLERYQYQHCEQHKQGGDHASN